MQQASTGGRATPSGQPHTGAFTEGAEVRGSRVSGTAGLFIVCWARATPVARHIRSTRKIAPLEWRAPREKLTKQKADPGEGLLAHPPPAPGQAARAGPDRACV